VESAGTTLATLVVKGRAPRTGYDRDLFGQAWADVDRNGCDTRNDILRRDLRHTTLKPGTHGCLVLTGTLTDPYTGSTIAFVRGRGTSNAVQVDHVVALSDAWQKGAQRWSTATRTEFANDPLNLLAVDGPTNQRKGDGDAATWLPPRKAVRCAYVARQIAVKTKYHLAVTASEKTQMARQLATCPGQPATPDVTRAPTRVDQNISDPGAPSRTPAAAHSGTGGGTVYYQNCDAARAAGAAPVHRGDPGYGAHLDRDGDGTACE